MKEALKIMILPGNGCTPIEKCNWYSWLKVQLQQHQVQVILKEMPDPYVAQEKIWLPFIEKSIENHPYTVQLFVPLTYLKSDFRAQILVGHSSGAEAAMRFAETTALEGLVLVGACTTDLGDDNERASGYYSRPWQFHKIKQNVNWVIQFGSPDDPFLPLSEQDEVAKGLDAEYHSLPGKGHYMSSEDSEILAAILEKLKQLKNK